MAMLDGKGAQGTLKVGTCATVCALSARTLRGHLSEAAADFLGSTANKSGIRVTDAQQFLTRVSSRMSDLWPGGGDPSFDTQPPTITVTGIQEADILHGTVMATIKVFDAIEMGTVTVTLSRGGIPVTGFYSQNPTSPDAQTRLVALTIRTTELADGPLLLHVDATDKASNRAQAMDLSLFLDNSPLGSISGTVVAGGRVAGARVRAWEYAAATKGKMLGQTTTDEEGVFKVEIMDTTAMVLLLEVDNMPVQAAAKYVEGTSGWMVTFSSDDRLESLLTGWRNGDKRPDGVVTSWTTMATALARGLYASPLYNSNPTQWSAAVEDAFKLLEDHFFSDTTRVSLRADQPAALTVEGTATFNSQARYGLILAALGQLADQQAFMSNATAASMNTLTLTRLLAQDLGQDGASSAPLFNGRTSAGELSHGRVSLTSYETRVNLAVAAVDFMTNNPRYKAPFTQLDVAALIDRLSADGNPRLYPASEPPLPFDTIKPDNVAFTSNTPAEGTVLRGDVTIEVTAHDNRALGALSWTAPATSGAITGVRLDQTAGLAGPWLLGGVLKSDMFPEGSLPVTARAVDQAQNATTVTRTFVVDRTPPVVTITEAKTATGGLLADGAWTGPTTLTVKGTVVDPHLASASYSVNGASSALQVAGGAWTVTIPMQTTGTYSLAIVARDQAGNASTPAGAVFNCDATPPTIAVVPSTFVDDSNRAALVDGSGAGAVTFDSNGGATITLTSGPVATFQKYPARYLGSSEQLPEWHFSVSDNHSQGAQVQFESRISRTSATGQTALLKDWSALGDATGSGYNRAQRISADVHADIRILSGTYTLDFRATDELGNRTPVGTVQWIQEILPPPLRQRAALDDSPCDPRIPSGHSLSATGPCAALHYTASVNLTGAAGTLRIAKGYIDNPNAEPVQIILQPSAPSFMRRGLLFKNVKVDDYSPVKKVCEATGTEPQLVNGTCFTPTTDSAEYGTTDVFDRDLASGVEITDAAFIGLYEQASVYEIPANSTATVWVISQSWAFLMDGAAADYPALGPLVNVTADTKRDWIACVDVNLNEVCSKQARMKEVVQLTRVAVRPAAVVSVTARPTGSVETTFRVATGVGVVRGSYKNFAWETQASGYSPF
jgi:hypothetical protein